MRKTSFLNSEHSLLVCMVQANSSDRIKELVQRGKAEGAEAFGMQLCRLKKEQRSREAQEQLFALASPCPVYVTNYRAFENSGKSDDELADELVELAECGATLCDVMGDYYDKTPGELTMNEEAIAKQMKLIERLHSVGAEVLMSSHICAFTPAERVLEIAMEHKRRGADISKIVTSATTMEEQIENLRITNLLREKLGIRFMFLAVGEYSSISRRIGGRLGNCMSLCVVEHDECATKAQPLLIDMKVIRDDLGF